MAKPKKIQKEEPKSSAEKQEMSLAEAKAYRAGLHKPAPKSLNEAQKREAFRIFWACNKAKYGKSKSLENALWLHLKAVGMSNPEQFQMALDNFGLKKV